MDIREAHSHFRRMSFLQTNVLDYGPGAAVLSTHILTFIAHHQKGQEKKTHAGSHRSDNKIFLHRLCAATGFSNDTINPTPTLNGKMFGFFFDLKKKKKKISIRIPSFNRCCLWITGFHRLVT
jgi:hypothetical protein